MNFRNFTQYFFLGDIVFVDLPTVEKLAEAGDQIAGVESVKAASDINMPIEGVITELNEKLDDDPSVINKDAQGEGWFFKFTPNNVSDLDNSNFMDEETYLASKKD